MQLPDLPNPNRRPDKTPPRETSTNDTANSLCVETSSTPKKDNQSTLTDKTSMATAADCTLPHPPISLHKETDTKSEASRVTEPPSGATTLPTITDNTASVHTSLERLNTSSSSLTVETDTTSAVTTTPVDQSTNTIQLNLRDETSSERHHVIQDESTKPSLPEYQCDMNNDSLREETTHNNTDSLREETHHPNAMNNIWDYDMTDKYHAAEGLLLLGTDVSSADDSQPPTETKLNNDGNVSETDSNKTIIQPNWSANPLIPQSNITPAVKSPKKGVLSFRQIGIK